MSQNQVRTSVRLMQKEGNSHNAKLSLNNLQITGKKHQDTAEHNSVTVTRKRRTTNADCLQDVKSDKDVQKTAKRSRQPKSGTSGVLDNDEPQKTNKITTLKNSILKNINNSDHSLSTSSSKSSNDLISPQNGQKLTDRELLAKYNKRLEDLKKSNIFSTTPIFETLCARYEMLRNDSRAAAMSKYMQHKFEYFGIQTPQRRACSADLWKDVRQLSSSDLRLLTQQTWFSPEREFHYFTVELLQREIFRIFEDEDLTINDLALRTLDFVKMFIDSPSSWWDTVDSLSSNVVGPLVHKYPNELLPEMDKWNINLCFWVCRTSILYQLLFKQDTDADRLFRYCLKVAEEEEFFIRKAVGWALRQYYRTDPLAVRNFVNKHKDKLSPLSVKEALKHDK